MMGDCGDGRVGAIDFLRKSVEYLHGRRKLKDTHILGRLGAKSLHEILRAIEQNVAGLAGVD